MTQPPSTTRAPDLSRLTRLARSGGATCLTLTGQAGAGKSVLARSLVASLREAEVEVALVDDLDPDTARAAVRSSQERSRLVVATSILPLGVASERAWPVRPLSPSGSAPAEAVRLVAELMAADADRLTSRDRSVLEWVSEEVGYLPLGLDLAAEMGRSLGLGWLARTAAAGELVDSLARPAADPDVRHPSLTAAIERTTAALDPVARQLLVELAHLSGGFTTLTAERCARRLGDVRPSRSLATLVDLALVCPRPAEGSRFMVSAPLRTHLSAVRLPDGMQGAAAREVLTDLARTQVVAVDRPGDTTVVNGLRDESPNLRDALHRTMAETGTGPAPGRLVEAVDLLAALSVVAASEPADAELERWATTLRSRSEELPPAARAMLVLASTELAAARREAPAERSPAELAADVRDGIDAARDSGDPLLLLRLLAVPIRRLLYVQDPALAVACAAEGYALATSIGSEPWLARFEAWSGMAARVAGADDRADELELRALARARRAGDDGAVITAAIGLLWPLRPRTHLPPTLPDHGSLLALSRARGDHQSEHVLVSLAGWQHLVARDFERAVASCRDWIALQYSQGPLPLGFSASWLLGLVADGRGDWEWCAHFLTDTVTPGVPEQSDPVIPQYGLLVDQARARVLARLGPARTEQIAAVARREGVWARLRTAEAYCDRLLGGPPVVRGWRSRLTVREQEVAELLAAGLTNKEIARRLSISTKTVMHHSGAVYRKLGVRSRTEATALIMREGDPELR